MDKLSLALMVVGIVAMVGLVHVKLDARGPKPEPPPCVAHPEQFVSPGETRKFSYLEHKVKAVGRIWAMRESRVRLRRAGVARPISFTLLSAAKKVPSSIRAPMSEMKGKPIIVEFTATIPDACPEGPARIAAEFWIDYAHKIVEHNRTAPPSPVAGPGKDLVELLGFETRTAKIARAFPIEVVAAKTLLARTEAYREALAAWHDDAGPPPWLRGVYACALLACIVLGIWWFIRVCQNR